MAMAMIMGLCLLVYNLGQRQLCQTLEQMNQTIPNQLKKKPKCRHYDGFFNVLWPFIMSE